MPAQTVIQARNQLGNLRNACREPGLTPELLTAVSENFAGIEKSAEKKLTQIPLS